ncbi:MAG: hypothetical protein ACREC0_04835, partial [Methylocella sp.]
MQPSDPKTRDIGPDRNTRRAAFFGLMNMERNSRRRLSIFYLSEAQVKGSYIILLYVYRYNKLNLAHILLFA